MNFSPLTPELLPQLGQERNLRILVGWDQSGEEAVHLAGWLARSIPSNVRVISTAQRPLSSLGRKGKQYKKWRKNTAEAHASEIRAALKEHVPRQAWNKDYAVLADGASRDALLTSEAERFHADVVLLGSKAKAAKGRFKATSTADSLMHSSPVPLGLAPRGVKLSKKGITRINFAFLDEHDEANEYGIASAAMLALTLDVDLRLIVFSPERTCNYSSRLDHASPLIDEWNETSLALLDRARDAVADLAEGVDLGKLKNFEVETVVSAGDGWGSAVDSQKWKKGDLLCVGSRPNGERRVFAGPRAADFIEHAPVPVLLLPRR